MGTGTLTNRSTGQIILETFFNDIHNALNSDFVGRNSSGVATSGQNLGTTAIPWGVTRTTSLVLNGSTVDSSLITRTQNTIISGKKRTTSNQAAFITPNGAALSFIVAGATTNLIYDVAGSTVTMSTDVTKSGLTAAPSSNNTCLVNDSEAADQAESRVFGEEWSRRDILIDTVGSEITALNGKYAAFMIDNGSATEYFIALVDTTNSRLRLAKRGYFYDSSLNPKNRIAFANNDTITLLKWGHVFAEDDGATVDVSYTVPEYSFTAPSSPATGDYWLDLANNVWKRYDGASWEIIDRTYIGSVVNTTSACVGARCEPFFARYETMNTMTVEKTSTSVITGKTNNIRVNVAGQRIYFGTSRPVWNITTDLASSVDMYNSTEQASTIYYLYLKDTGDTVISDISPYWSAETLGPYHPHNPWRCVGIFYNDSSSDIRTCNAVSQISDCRGKVHTANGYGNSNGTATRRFTTISEEQSASILYEDSVPEGADFTCWEPGIYMALASDGFNAAGEVGIAKNSSARNTQVSSIAVGERLAVAFTDTSGRNITVTWAGLMKVGDFWTVQTDGGTSTTVCEFTWEKLSTMLF